MEDHLLDVQDRDIHMKSSIFLRTCQRDIRWAEWCLKSIGKYWKTESQIVVSANLECKPAIQSFQQFVGSIKLIVEEQWEPGWNFQQYTKMMCDSVCDGEFVTFIDSDCVFNTECRLEDLMEDGKPIIWFTEYAKIPGPHWKGNIERLLKVFVEYEFMRRFPITYRRDTLKPAREYVQRLHGVSVKDMLTGLPTHVFSEFNILGNYAFQNEFSSYAWKHTDEIDLHPEKYQWHVPVRQFNWFEWDANTPKLLSEIVGFDDTSLNAEGHVGKTPESGQKALSEKIASFVDRGDIFIDVGAHEGYHVAACANKDCAVYSFEPNPLSFVKLWEVHEKRHLNSKSGKCYPYAVSDTVGTVNFQLDLQCSEASFVSIEASPGTITVPCVTLDQLFDSARLIKIDVEGFELHVLRGATKLIRNARPIVILECQKETLKRSGHTREDIERFLKDQGYEWEISTTDPRASVQEDDYFYDMICQPVEK